MIIMLNKLNQYKCMCCIKEKYKKKSQSRHRMNHQTYKCTLNLRKDF